jgi:hypothetical protein
MGDQGWIAVVADQRGQRVDQAQALVGTGQKQDATVGTDLPGIEGGGDLLPANTWQSEWEQGSVNVGGMADPVRVPELVSASNLYAIPDSCTMPTSESLLCSE